MRRLRASKGKPPPMSAGASFSQSVEGCGSPALGAARGAARGYGTSVPGAVAQTQ